MPATFPASYVPGCLVESMPPTDHRCSGWRATITRGNTVADRYRVRVPWEAGPDAAAAAAVDRFNECMGAEWIVLGAPLSMNNGTAYAYPVGPAYCAETLRPAAGSPADSQTLDAVAALLSADTWSPDHLDAVADMVRATGRIVTDPSDCEGAA